MEKKKKKKKSIPPPTELGKEPEKEEEPRREHDDNGDRLVDQKPQRQPLQLVRDDFRLRREVAWGMLAKDNVKNDEM
jgi:hypothetical protein